MQQKPDTPARPPTTVDQTLQSLLQSTGMEQRHSFPRAVIDFLCLFCGTRPCRKKITPQYFQKKTGQHDLELLISLIVL